MKLYLLGRENLKVYKLPIKIEESVAISVKYRSSGWCMEFKKYR